VSNYQALTFVSGEVPGVATWNILNTNDASFANGTGVSALTVGSVTNVTNPYKFGYWMNTAFNFTSTPTVLEFDTKEFDTSSNYATGTGLFTAPIAGFYQFSFSVFAASAGEAYYSSLYKNGSEFKRAPYFTVSSSPYLAQGASGISVLVQAATNDTFGIYIYSDTTHAGTTGQALNYFQGFLVSNA
jgi:hypothetical protein